MVSRDEHCAEKEGRGVEVELRVVEDPMMGHDGGNVDGRSTLLSS